eukprot:SAG31_NODE_3917_length_3753_cov_2.846196_2_plen_42_part_00
MVLGSDVLQEAGEIIGEVNSLASQHSLSYRIALTILMSRVR